MKKKQARRKIVQHPQSKNDLIPLLQLVVVLLILLLTSLILYDKYTKYKFKNSMETSTKQNEKQVSF